LQIEAQHGLGELSAVESALSQADPSITIIQRCEPVQESRGKGKKGDSMPEEQKRRTEPKSKEVIGDRALRATARDDILQDAIRMIETKNVETELERLRAT